MREDVPLGHEKFGRVEPCICRLKILAESARDRLFELSRLDRLKHLTFENFSEIGNKNAKFLTPQDFNSLRNALIASENFADHPEKWLLLEGGYGCGKTHLAAAISNSAVAKGIPTLFITVPDLLDTLRFAFNDPETTLETRFEEIRNVSLLVLDDFGTQNATSWAQEKLFQILNYRYINNLPTVITTNLMLDEIESRIRSRLQDEEFVTHVRITSPDYRRPTETSNPGISMLSLVDIARMKFENFFPREEELGKEVATTITIEKDDKFRNRYKETEIIKSRVTKEDIKSLRDAFRAAIDYAKDPNRWLVFLGGSFCGKTHLAAAIGNDRLSLGGQAIMVDISALLDYLRQTFGKNSDVTFNRRFHEISTTPLLILDKLKPSGTNSLWAEEKLHQILDHRYYANYPTVITSTLDPDNFAKNYPGLWNRLLDKNKCDVYVITMPPYRSAARKTGQKFVPPGKNKN